MVNRVSQNVSLTAELSAFIQAQVASGAYQSTSEVVRAALRLLIQQETRKTSAQPKPRGGRAHAR